MKKFFFIALLCTLVFSSFNSNTSVAQEISDDNLLNEVERLHSEIESLTALINQLIALHCAEDNSLDICPSEEEDANVVEEELLPDNYETGFPQLLSEANNPETLAVISTFMGEFLNSLADYYNNESDAVLAMTTENAVDIVGENRMSELYEDYELIDFQINSIVQVDVNTYVVNITRDYSHVSSDGPATDNVTYTIIKQEDELFVANY